MGRERGGESKGKVQKKACVNMILFSLGIGGELEHEA